jgi:tripartite-type tricarboxylate transporter receptor subunit TctC
MTCSFFRQLALLTFLGFMLVGTSAFPAGFPEKPVRFIIGFSAGAGIDLEARGIAPYVQKHLGVQVIIENVPGANSKVALTKVWRAPPDGYRIMVQSTTASIIGQYMLNPEYRIPDFSHIFSWSYTNQVLVVNSDVYKTFDDFVKDSKKRTLTAGLPGLASSSTLSGFMLEEGLGIKVNWVPFDGGGDALVALAGKHIDFAAVATTSALSLVKAGKLNALVMLSNTKDIVFPNLPLAKDLGYKFPVIPVLRGADAPPGTPPAVIKKLEIAFAKAVREPEYLSWAKSRMMTTAPLNSMDYGKAIDEQQQQVEQYKKFLQK